MDHFNKFLSLLGLITVFYLTGLILQEKHTGNCPATYLTSEEQEEIEKLFSADKIRKIDSLFQAVCIKERFNGSVIVACDQNIIFRKNTGWADFADKVPITDTSAFNLASVSKQFTAVAVIILNEQGKLDFDDDITKYLDVPYSGITVRYLLNHTSGLPNYMWVLEHYWKGSTPPDNLQAVELFSLLHPQLYFKPGNRFSYSNTNYFFLACIIEKISGLSYPSFIEKNILGPAGMNHSFVYTASLPVDKPNRIRGYHRCRNGYCRIDDTVNDGVTGDKGVYSTCDDLVKWDKALYSGLLISTGSVAEAFRPLKLANGREQPYGFGFRLAGKNDHHVVYHNGLWNGFRTSFYRYTDKRNTIIVMNNVDSHINSYIIDATDKIINDDQPDCYTKLLAQSAIKDGLPTAKIYIANYKAVHPEMQINSNSLLDLVLLLYEFNKPVLASQVKQLYNIVVKSDNDQSDK
jgi:CubicO group peptidase (beta-lactamase class C family)